ncbi:hypothetical protein Belba_2376 [Belliella baltica DSM 15883]|uniref:Uncharacterized protein n=1 Tax=Belliella baltica (strain DSM 15883 / CIP 108006 / LMG 21964 / BA134) TaxID=866536 RepID=I3Z6R8_BELBD|nr:hypothetical protein [Belliella baltica]AFL84936.1 hypothetical protein Belba_2376 [Belliella baltica DSM 15883]
MIIKRKEDQITFKLDSKKLSLIEIQAISDWLEYLELSGFKNSDSNEVQNIVSDAKRGRWERLKSKID